MVVVDILSVSMSVYGNKYLLVVQDYFTEWADAIPLPNQKAVTITKALTKLFATVDYPRFCIQTKVKTSSPLDAFGTQKSRTTAYCPQGNGLVDRFNRSLLQLLGTYVDKECDWEQHLPLALYAYRTAVHTSTGVSPHVLMFGREPRTLLFDSQLGFDPSITSKQSLLNYKTWWNLTW